MPNNDFIDVRVLVGNELLQEHDDPGGNGDKRGTAVRYVEATTGQEFAVQVKILPGFNLRHAPWLCSMLYIDNIDKAWQTAIPCKDLPHSRGVLLQEHTHLFRTTALKDQQGLWRIAPYTFGALGITDEAPTQNGLTPEQVSKIGTIRISFYRAKRTLKAVPEFWHGGSFSELDEISEKQLKGREIKNNVKINATNKASPAPEPELYNYHPIQGTNGKSMNFYFKYRNRKIMQHLGLIERSPSPEPDHKLIAQRTEEMLRMEKEARRKANLEILRLRQQLEGRGTASRESTVTLTEDGAPPRGQKRERDEDEEDVQQMAPPAK